MTFREYMIQEMDKEEGLVKRELKKGTSYRYPSGSLIVTIPRPGCVDFNYALFWSIQDFIRYVARKYDDQLFTQLAREVVRADLASMKEENKSPRGDEV